jgi:MoxR-like ATPase
VDDTIADYLLEIVHGTREGDEVHVGVSTRGALMLYRAAQSLALVSGRDYVVPDDVKTLAVPVLAHRVIGKSFLQAGEFGAAEAIIRDVVDRIRVPT